MHSLYKVKYTLIEAGNRHHIWDTFLFTDEEQHDVAYTYYSFGGLYDSVVSNELPIIIDFDKTMFLKKPCVYINGNQPITERNFINPTSIKVEYHECLPKHYGLDFFKQKLTMDEFVTFLQEHYGQETLAIALNYLSEK